MISSKQISARCYGKTILPEPKFCFSKSSSASQASQNTGSSSGATSPVTVGNKSPQDTGSGLQIQGSVQKGASVNTGTSIAGDLTIETDEGAVQEALDALSGTLSSVQNSEAQDQSTIGNLAQNAQTGGTFDWQTFILQMVEYGAIALVAVLVGYWVFHKTKK